MAPTTSTGQSPNSIGRANLDGTGVEPSFITGAGPPVRNRGRRQAHLLGEPSGQRLAATGVATGSIGRANLNGTGVDPSFIANVEFDTRGPSRSTARHIYWYESNESQIARAKLDGTHVDHRFLSRRRDRLLAWRSTPGTSTGQSPWHSIGRANLDGTHVHNRFITKADVPQGVAVNTLPDTKLAGKATAATTQGQTGKEIVVRVKLRAKEQLTAKASGEIRVNPTYKLRPKTVKLAAGKTKTLKLKPKKKAARKIATALKRGEKANAKVTVRLTDLAGNTETEKLRVTLKR